MNIFSLFLEKAFTPAITTAGFLWTVLFLQLVLKVKNQMLQNCHGAGVKQARQCLPAPRAGPAPILPSRAGTCQARPAGPPPCLAPKGNVSESPQEQEFHNPNPQHGAALPHGLAAHTAHPAHSTQITKTKISQTGR